MITQMSWQIFVAVVKLLKLHFFFRCKCGQCIQMNTERECVCCHNYAEMLLRMKDDSTCITETNGFRVNCMDMDSLEASTYEFVMIEGPIGDAEPMHE